MELAPDGAPCERGTVGLLSSSQGRIESAVIEADGSMLFDAVLRGSYQVHVACADHVARSLSSAWGTSRLWTRRAPSRLAQCDPVYLNSRIAPGFSRAVVAPPFGELAFPAVSVMM